MSEAPRQWKPDVYLAFADYRARPVADLLRRITLSVAGAITDLGCGPGNVTAMLTREWPERRVTGVNSSPAMIAAARRAAADNQLPRNIQWQEGDIARWRAETPPALIFSNAALHWVADHKHLLPRLVGALAPGGVIAVQMPNTADAPYKDCARAVVGQPAWRERLAGVSTHPDPLRAAAYYEILAEHAGDIDIWESHYHHVLADLDAVVKWASGAALTPYLSVLDEAEKARFLADYKTAAAAVYRPQQNGNILFTMRRLFFVARRPA